MLIEFRVGNFRSFAEPQNFSLVASPDTRHPDNCIPFGKQRLLKSAGLFGANASGKSNLIKAIDFMWRFVLHSATRMNVGDEIPVVSFQLDPDSRGKASFFETQFVIDDMRYQYGFTATSKRVQDEWLIAYPKSRPQHLLERSFDLESSQTTWAFRGELHKKGTLLRERTRDNGLVLSRGAEMNIGPLTTVFLWFLRKMAVFDLSDSLSALIQQTAVRIKDAPVFRERVLRLIRHADLGIGDLEVTEQHARYVSASLPASLIGESWPMSSAHGPAGTVISGTSTSSVPVTVTSGTTMWSVPMTVASGTTTDIPGGFSFPIGHTIQSIHRATGGEPVRFNFLEAESNGTQRFFALAGPWLDALDQGGLLVIDELDCSMHPTLTRKLIELFQTRGANPKGAQLVFSTHDSTLMDQELFRRDQIWIVEKDQAGASRLSSLYDFEEKPRNNEALQRRYLAGRYGGVPVFGPTFEDLELK
jgi:AAA15 family ATPase/GTPase